MFRIRETFKGFAQVIKQCQRYYFDSFVPHGFFRELVEKNRRHNGLYAVRFRSFGTSIWKDSMLDKEQSDCTERKNFSIIGLVYYTYFSNIIHSLHFVGYNSTFFSITFLLPSTNNNKMINQFSE